MITDTHVHIRSHDTKETAPLKNFVANYNITISEHPYVSKNINKQEILKHGFGLGIELDIKDDIIDKQTPIDNQTSFVIASSHNTTTSEEHLEELLFACSIPYVTSIGHPFGGVYMVEHIKAGNITTKMCEELAKASIKYNKMIEINGTCLESCVKKEYSQILSSIINYPEVKYCIGSDAHKPSELKRIKNCLVFLCEYATW